MHHVSVIVGLFLVGTVFLRPTQTRHQSFQSCCLVTSSVRRAFQHQALLGHSWDLDVPVTPIHRAVASSVRWTFQGVFTLQTRWGVYWWANSLCMWWNAHALSFSERTLRFVLYRLWDMKSKFPVNDSGEVPVKTKRQLAAFSKHAEAEWVHEVPDYQKKCTSSSS